MATEARTFRLEYFPRNGKRSLAQNLRNYSFNIELLFLPWLEANGLFSWQRVSDVRRLSNADVCFNARRYLATSEVFEPSLPVFP